MRLLRLDDLEGLSLTKHDEDKLPPYAILSHTWGPDDEEVVCSDLKDGSGKSKAGYAEILFCGRQARKDDLHDFWVDSCCINKDSDAELSEALNSMFRWYQRSAKCYVYLQDVSALKRDRGGQGDWQSAFKRSRWFTRGWTLQEPLAPKVVEFWSRDGTPLGTKESLKDLIFEITGIPHRALCGAILSSFPPAERLRWAAKRDTKRTEDKAYSMLGVLDVSMTPRYGEGDRAFDRLQRKIEKAWNPPQRTSTIDFEPQKSQDDEAPRLEQRQALLASLGFEQLDARHATIKEAQRSTCEWILDHPDYAAWNSGRCHAATSRNILWIAGKPGAGKSTLMKFLLARADRPRAEDEIVVSFFFNARASDLEKETRGMYRGILIQLLNAAPDLQDTVDEFGVADSNAIHSTMWTIEVSQRLLSNIVRKLGKRHVTCYIDALDECDEQDVQDMVDFFGELGAEVLPGQSRLLFCFASRHYPTLLIRNSLRVVLEDQDGHAEDLRKYIRRRLKAGERDDLGAVYAQIEAKANGVFLWVALVVNILNREYRRGRMFAVQRRLSEIPTGLSDLFKELLERDRVNMDALLLCLQWLLWSERPLSYVEFYLAMISGLEKDWKLEPWDTVAVTKEHIERFVHNASKGLAELTGSHYGYHQPTVQFIHESVRDFLLKEGGVQQMWPHFGDDFVSSSHDRLKECCQRYLAAVADVAKARDSGKRGPSAMYPTFHLHECAGDTQAKIEPYGSGLFANYPFLAYAGAKLLHHTDAAAGHLAQGQFLQASNIDAWICATTYNGGRVTRRHHPGNSLHYILAALGYSRLITGLHRDDEDKWTRYPGTKYQFAFMAAFARGNCACLRALLGDAGAPYLDDITNDTGFGNRPDAPLPSSDVLLWAAKRHNWGICKYFMSLHAGRGLYTIEDTSKPVEYFNDVLALAIAADETHVVQLLLDKEAISKIRLCDALVAAAEQGRRHIVQLLLEHGVDIDARSARSDKTALHCAAESGYEQTVQLLLDRGADVHVLSASGTALHAAAGAGKGAIVQQLLNAGADANIRSSVSGTPLHHACYYGGEAAIQVLLDAGATVDRADYDTANSLNRKAVAQCLLDSGRVPGMRAKARPKLSRRAVGGALAWRGNG